MYARMRMWLSTCRGERSAYGNITDRDMVIRGIAKGCDPKTTKASEVMTEKVVYCFEDDDIIKAAEQMKSEQIRRLIVLNKDKRMTGVVSIGDVARASNDNQLTGEIECGVARPSQSAA
jgi:CBS domain-containing protein